MASIYGRGEPKNNSSVQSFTLNISRFFTHLSLTDSFSVHTPRTVCLLSLVYNLCDSVSTQVHFKMRSPNRNTVIHRLLTGRWLRRLSLLRRYSFHDCLLAGLHIYFMRNTRWVLLQLRSH